MMDGNTFPFKCFPVVLLSSIIMYIGDSHVFGTSQVPEEVRGVRFPCSLDISPLMPVLEIELRSSYSGRPVSVPSH